MQAQYPANTNVLYVDLPSVEKIASSQSSQSLPGMILNLKKPIVYKDYLGVTHRLDASFQITIVHVCLLKAVAVNVVNMQGILDLYIEIAVPVEMLYNEIHNCLFTRLIYIYWLHKL